MKNKYSNFSNEELSMTIWFFRLQLYEILSNPISQPKEQELYIKMINEMDEEKNKRISNGTWEEEIQLVEIKKGENPIVHKFIDDGKYMRKEDK